MPMRPFIFGLIAVLVFGVTQSANACGPEVRIQFVEESPDQFQIQFVRGPKLRLSALTINLRGSAAGAMFDDYGGMPMQGPQPNANGVTIRSITYSTQGGERVDIAFDNFLAESSATLHTDLDDRGLAADRDENHLHDGELMGASAVATLLPEAGKPIQIEGTFDQQGQAVLGSRACV